MKNAADFSTRASGKLLLTGEYFVLDGALALAMPVRFGQTLKVSPTETKGPPKLHWQSLEPDGAVWFSADFDLKNLSPEKFTDEKTAQTLQAILKKCREQNPAFLLDYQSVSAKTQTDFPREWGLGTSSTLIAAVAKWAEHLPSPETKSQILNPYQTLFETFGGSGYDIACAYANSPILYRILSPENIEIQPVAFSPEFSKNLYFVFLGKKQNSREGIRRYRERAEKLKPLLPEISRLTEKFRGAKSLHELEVNIREHEKLVGDALGLPRAKSLYFNDFWGEIKSLGAWGGDFVLVASEKNETLTRCYFEEKGFRVFFSFAEMAV